MVRAGVQGGLPVGFGDELLVKLGFDLAQVATLRTNSSLVLKSRARSATLKLIPLVHYQEFSPKTFFLLHCFV
jgi:hypothetical protein